MTVQVWLNLGQKGKQGPVAEKLLPHKSSQDLPHRSYDPFPDPAQVTCRWRIKYPGDILLQQEVVNFALVQFVEGFSKLPFFSLKVCAIFAPDDSLSSSTTYEPDEGVHEGGHVQAMCNFDVDCSWCKSCEETPVV